MIKHKEKIKIALIATILIAFTILIVPNLVVSFINETYRNQGSRLDNDGVGPIEIVDENTIEGTCGEFEVTEFNERQLAISTGRIIYCIQHGTGFVARSGTLKMEVASQYGDTEGSIFDWGWTYNGCSGMFAHNGETTYPYLKCVGEHHDLLAEGYEDVAYIITYPPMDEWTIDKQYAIWRTNLNTGHSLTSAGTPGIDVGDSDEERDPEAFANSEIIYNEAQKYKSFHEKTHQNGGNSDLKVKNKTDKDKVRTAVNQTQASYIMGPVSIDYNYGAENGVAFGGISDMYAIGYNSKGKVVFGKERIDINKYYDQNGISYELNKDTYYTPSKDYFVDYGEQVYPKGISQGENQFYFEFSDPNANIDYTVDNYEDYMVSYVKLHIEFQWMECPTCVVCGLDCAAYTVRWNHMHSSGTKGYNCHTTSWLEKREIQDNVSVLEGGRRLYKTSLEIGEPDNDTPPTFNLQMQLAGYVWVDGSLNDKMNTPYNGVSGDSNDVALPNTKVILFNKLGKKVRETTTDNDGCYIFTVNSMEKYYVAFEYNGQLYVPTIYNKPEYNSAEWLKSSKATEKVSDRDALNAKFATIGAYPNSYSGGKIYSMEQLVEDDVIDCFFEIQNGEIVEVNTLNKAEKRPSTDQKRFMDDCKIKAYTMEQGAQAYDLYPVYDKFIINTNKKFNTGKEARSATFDTTGDVFNGEYYVALYPGQFYIDLGLVRRKINDLALRKDVFRAATKINGKTEVYKYKSRPDDDNEEYWDITVRQSDTNYYNSVYNREIFEADYAYRVSEAHPGAELEIFVTYKITIRNQSQGIIDTINEVVDYYDNEYKYRSDLSWVTYDDNAFRDEEYYKTIHTETLQMSNAKPVNSSEEKGKVYIKGLKDKKLETGEVEYIYLTFQVKKDNNGIILDNSDKDAKQNVAEINGYTSYYKDETLLPNGVTKGSRDYAGILDIDSVPGNADDLGDIQDESKYEDDTDKAKGLRIKFYDNASRKINGIVWDDLRTEKVNDSMIGNGLKDENNGIGNIKVELVEKLANGGEYVWRTTTLGNKNQETTNTDGKYEFKDYIPGDYIVRFTYGGQYNSKYNGQDYKSTTYQKGINQRGRTNYENASAEIISAVTELGQKLYYGYTNVENQNTSGSYGYSIAKSNGKNVSDAKDIWSYREAVNKYSSNNYRGVTNGLAQTLANTGTANTNTQMVAETGVISIEVEYNRIFTGDESGAYHIKDVDLGLTERPKAQLELSKHVDNVRITLANGNVLYDANDTVPNLAWVRGKDYNLRKDKKYFKPYRSEYLYNATQEQVNRHVASLYNGGKNGLIQIIMDSELMHGATIRIDYKLTVKNVGETDYTGKEFYYKGTNPGNIVTTSGDVLVDYVANNLQYREVDNTGWSTVNTGNLAVSDSVKAAIKNKTIIKTEKFKQDLKPGDVKVDNLVLSQTITSQNTSDDMTYDNIAEIIQYSNTVGRRMAYSVVGNQNPNNMPAEVDTAAAEKVIILPPFGQTYLYLGIGLAAIAIIAVGIVVIKKKVLKK